MAHHKQLVIYFQAAQAEHKGMTWPPEPAPADEPSPEPAAEPPAAPGEPIKSVKGKPTSLEQAMERAKTSKCCQPRKSDGIKGCTKCMGQYFGAIRLRAQYGKSVKSSKA